MAELRFDISLLFNQYFQLSGRFITFPDVQLQRESGDLILDYKNVEVVDESELREGTNYLGLPIMFPMTLKGGNYNVYNRQGEIEQISLDDFRLPLTTLVDFDRSKIKQTTPVSGGHSQITDSTDSRPGTSGSMVYAWGIRVTLRGP